MSYTQPCMKSSTASVDSAEEEERLPARQRSVQDTVALCSTHEKSKRSPLSERAQHYYVETE